MYLTSDGTQLSDVAVTDFDWLEELFRDSPSPLDFEKFGPWFDMAQDREKAFLFHESCWSALIEHFENREVDLNKLFEVCKNIPGSAGPSGSKVSIPTRIIILIDTYAYSLRLREGKERSMASSRTAYYPGD